MGAAQLAYIERIHLENIRGFRDLTLDLRLPDGSPRMRTLVLGKNGTGKSTLLRALATSLVRKEDSFGLLSAPLGRLDSKGKSEIQFRGPGGHGGMVSTFRFSVQESRAEETLLGAVGFSANGDVFVCGYGAGRYGTKSGAESEYRAASAVGTLFRYEQALLDPELVLHRLQSLRTPEIDDGPLFRIPGGPLYQRTLRGLLRVLGLTDEDRIETKPRGGIEISGPTVGGTIPFEAWADGYRMTFSWLLDLYGWAMQADAIDEDGHVQGVLLIDEIDQHLHPSMQAEILPRLSALLPKMQIFATTHSPLVALDAKPEELVVLRREGDEVIAVPDVPDFTGYSVEDMLADPRIFDSEIYGGEMRSKLDRYRELVEVAPATRSLGQSEELTSLAKELRPTSPQQAESETARLLKEIVRKYDL